VGYSENGSNTNTVGYVAPALKGSNTIGKTGSAVKSFGSQGKVSYRQHSDNMSSQYSNPSSRGGNNKQYESRNDQGRSENNYKPAQPATNIKVPPRGYTDNTGNRNTYGVPQGSSNNAKANGYNSYQTNQRQPVVYRNPNPSSGNGNNREYTNNGGGSHVFRQNKPQNSQKSGISTGGFYNGHQTSSRNYRPNSSNNNKQSSYHTVKTNNNQAKQSGGERGGTTQYRQVPKDLPQGSSYADNISITTERSTERDRDYGNNGNKNEYQEYSGGENYSGL